MSSENITGFVRGLLQEDDSLTGANDCRNSISKIKREIEMRFPASETEILVYPKGRKGNGVHYSLLVSQNGEKTLINAVAAPGFPEYIGDFDLAVPTFSAMRVTPEVI